MLGPRAVRALRKSHPDETDPKCRRATLESERLRDS